MLTKTLETPVYYNPDLTQIINGEEIMSPSPRFNHQEISANLFEHLRNFTKANDLGKACFAPLDVIFKEDFNVLQPDLLFISRANAAIIQDWIRGIPDLVIEIISPSSVQLDTVIKKNIYERYGVPECWLVFPKENTIEIYSLVENKYELYRAFGFGEQVTSPILPGLSFSLDSIFE